MIADDGREPTTEQQTAQAPGEPAAADTAANDAANDGDGGRSDEAAPAAEPTIETLAAENAELRDRLLRALADLDNARKRAEREREDAARYGIAAFARDVLSIGDNLARAIGAVDDATRNSVDEAVRNLIVGIEMTEREMLNEFERHGIRRIDPRGDRFDPNLHQAMFEVERADAAPGTVVEVVQPGYVIHERVLRPAMVGVAKAPSAA